MRRIMTTPLSSIHQRVKPCSAERICVALGKLFQRKLSTGNVNEIGKRQATVAEQFALSIAQHFVLELCLLTLQPRLVSLGGRYRPHKLADALACPCVVITLRAIRQILSGVNSSE